MKTTLPILAGLMFLASLVYAQPDSELETPPTFKIVTSIDKAKGHIVFVEPVNQIVPFEVERVVVKNGKEVTEKVTVFKYAVKNFTRVIDVKTSRIITPDGKQLPADEVWKRVKAKMVVVVSATSEGASSQFLRRLAADTLIIIPPREMIPDPPAPKKE